jgi:glycosyltransferase involved in cell wall biosynthesis
MAEVSIVIPVFNEVESIPDLAAALSAFRAGYPKRTEVVFVDDGSKDGSREALARLVEATPGNRLVALRCNRGQTAAMAAGLDAARGRVIIFMDADLQNDPRDIPALVARLDEGYDLVSGWRRRRQDSALTRNLPSRIANRLIGLVTGVRVHDYGCSLKAYRAEVVKATPLYSDMHRFLPALCARAGARISEIEVRHHPRRQGRSKYGLDRVFKVLVDLSVIKLITAFADRPMHYFGLLSAGFFVASAASLWLWLFNLQEGWKASTIITPSLVVLFFSSFLYFLCLGLLADLILRVRGKDRGRRERELAAELPAT